MSTTTVFAEIVKADRNADGDLVVVGKATGPDLDLDQQVCDPDWLGKAMPTWFSTGGNIREQHSSIAAGVATELSKTDGDAWMLSGTIVDPVSARKVELGVLKGFSVGIKNPRLITDKAAAGGRIVDGQIVEVSLVDRPCNPTCTLTLAKAATPGMTVKAVDLDADTMLVKVEELHEHNQAAGADVEADTGKRDFTQADRDTAADAGQAMPDGSFPITTVQDLKNAIQAVARAKDPAKAKAHIKSRAKALGQTALIPDGWKNVAATAAAVLDAVKALIPDDDADNDSAQTAITEIAKLVTATPSTEEDLQVVAVVAADTTHTSGTVSTKGALPEHLTELVDAAVQKATAATEQRYQALEATMAKVLATPVPGGPAITRSTDDEARITKAATTAEVLRLQRLADVVTDREMAAFYRTKAANLAAHEGVPS